MSHAIQIQTQPGTARLSAPPATGLGETYDNLAVAGESSPSSTNSYAVARATIEARKQGYLVTEQPLTDGSIRLTHPPLAGETTSHDRDHRLSVGRDSPGN